MFLNKLLYVGLLFTYL